MLIFLYRMAGSGAIKELLGWPIVPVLPLFSFHFPVFVSCQNFVAVSAFLVQRRLSEV